MDEAVAVVMSLRDLELSTSADLNFISGYICEKQPHLLHRTKSQENENYKRQKNSTENFKPRRVGETKTHQALAGRED